MILKFLLLFLMLSSASYAQDRLHKERYEVINALFKDGAHTLDERFLQFWGIDLLIRNPELMDNQFGDCIDYDKKEIYKFSDILAADDISNLSSQIGWFRSNRIIDSTMISDNIKIADDSRNVFRAITLPLIHKDKAVVYLTNKNNQDTLFVLVKEEGEWVIRCTKYVYLVFNH